MSNLTKEQIEANINEWLNRLENGGLKQTTDVLKRRNGSMCCLGVACEVVSLSTVYEPYDKVYYFEDPDTIDFDGKVRSDYQEIPGYAYRKLGLKDGGGSFTINNTLISLATLNDGVKDYETAEALGVKIGKKYTFKEIAAIIRSKPKGLFDRDYDIAPPQS